MTQNQSITVPVSIDIPILLVDEDSLPSRRGRSAIWLSDYLTPSPPISPKESQPSRFSSLYVDSGQATARILYKPSQKHIKLKKKKNFDRISQSRVYQTPSALPAISTKQTKLKIFEGNQRETVSFQEWQLITHSSSAILAPLSPN